MLALAHICAHLRIYTYMHASTHNSKRLRVYAGIYNYMRTYTHVSCIYAYMLAYTHICKHPRMYARINTYMLTYTHICVHLRVYARIYSFFVTWLLLCLFFFTAVAKPTWIHLLTSEEPKEDRKEGDRREVGEGGGEG